MLSNEMFSCLSHVFVCLFCLYWLSLWRPCLYINGFISGWSPQEIKRRKEIWKRSEFIFENVSICQKLPQKLHLMDEHIIRFINLMSVKHQKSRLEAELTGQDGKECDRDELNGQDGKDGLNGQDGGFVEPSRVFQARVCHLWDRRTWFPGLQIIT